MDENRELDLLASIDKNYDAGIYQQSGATITMTGIAQQQILIDSFDMNYKEASQCHMNK